MSVGWHVDVLSLPLLNWSDQNLMSVHILGLWPISLDRPHDCSGRAKDEKLSSSKESPATCDLCFSSRISPAPMPYTQSAHIQIPSVTLAGALSSYLSLPLDSGLEVFTLLLKDLMANDKIDQLMWERIILNSLQEKQYIYKAGLLRRLEMKFFFIREIYLTLEQYGG